MGAGTQNVTPFTGVWIEIQYPTAPPDSRFVTPFTGVWIEISLATNKPRR